nr:molecular chaperone TorD family protein [Adlercreutzia rubneri]
MGAVPASLQGGFVGAGNMRETIGLADGCELMGALTRFPDSDLALAVTSGLVRDDAIGCARDIVSEHVDGQGDAVEILCEGFGCVGNEEVDALCSALRRAWSLLYVRQGSGVAVFPYESAFIHVRTGVPGEPALFRSALTLRVERTMRESGVLPKDAETEPCDSVWNEWAFLSFLIGSEAKALREGDEESAALWRDRSADFVCAHVSQWMSDFFKRTAEEVDRLAEAGKIDVVAKRFYGALAAYGHLLLAALNEREGLQQR